MDAILTDFIGQTQADPALAQDLLDASGWDIKAALAMFSGLKDTRAVEPAEYEYDPSDFEYPSSWNDSGVNSSALSSITEGVDTVEGGAVGLVGGAKNLEDNEAKRRQVIGRQRRHRGRGLSFLAGDVVDKFTKVAISKLKVSSKEQVIIDERFFHHSFSYPDFSDESEELQEFIANDLLETTHKKALEKSGRLNWWTTTGKLPRLEPLATSGDGNCLLHAASLYMWGFHDRELILRTALHRLLTSSHECERIRRRWRYLTQLRNNEAGGLTFSEEEWEFEWGEIVRIATNQPRRQPTTASLKRYSTLRLSYESLEEIHIFALAHVLRRPIIVIADSAIKDIHGEDLAPIYFGGIYLPLEISATACSQTPVVLAYDASHFSPLVARRDVLSQPRVSGKFSRLSSRTETVIPLVSPSGTLLPVQFIIDPRNKSVSEKWGNMQYNPGEFPEEIIRLLEQYMKIRWIQLNVSSFSSTDEDYDHLFPIQVPKVRFPSAVILQESQPIYQKELIEKYLDNIRQRYEEEKERRAEMERERVRKEQEYPVPCEGAGCDMFGKASTNNLCSMCYQKWETARAGGSDVADKGEVAGASLGQIRSSEDSTVLSTEHNASHSQGGESPILAAYPPPPNSHLPQQQPHVQLPSFQNPPEHSPLKQLPPVQTPPKYSPPMYSGIASESATDVDKRQRHEKPLQSKGMATAPSATIYQQQRETTAERERKTSPSRSPSERVMPDNQMANVKAKSSPSHSSHVTGKDKSWTKRLNILPAFSPFAKSNVGKGGSGYTRDNIKPIKLSSDGERLEPVATATTSGLQRVKCVNSACEFFGRQETDGYCSSCFKQIQQNGPIVTV